MNWLFLDMDGYFASVEQHLRPELRERTVAVVPVVSDNTVVIASSPDAKRVGVKVGVTVRDARRLCPHIAFVQARPDLYVKVHQELIRSVETCAPVEKVYSIDEWSIRLRGEERRAERAVSLANQIKRQLLRDFSPWLTCSIGIAPTRLLAKIASDIQKPNGLVVLPAEEVPVRLEHCKLEDFAGIGKSMLRRLNDAEIYTVRQLWELSRDESRRIWGSVQGEAWWMGFHGFDTPEQPTQRRSIQHANMLGPENRTDVGAHGVLLRLICKGARRLRSSDLVAHRLDIRVNSYNGGDWGAGAALDAVQATPTIIQRFESLWQTRPWVSPNAAREARQTWRAFSQVVITLSGLAPRASVTPSLFSDPKPDRLSEAMDRINRRWGQNAVYVGAMHEFRHRMDDKIAFGRIPEQVDG